MTKRKSIDDNLLIIGGIIRKYRKELCLEGQSIEFFLEDRKTKGLLAERSISEKTLKNIEGGYTLPNLSTLKVLAPALEVDFLQLVEEIYPYIPIRS